MVKKEVQTYLVIHGIVIKEPKSDVLQGDVTIFYEIRDVITNQIMSVISEGRQAAKDRIFIQKNQDIWVIGELVGERKIKTQWSVIIEDDRIGKIQYNEIRKKQGW